MAAVVVAAAATTTPFCSTLPRNSAGTFSSVWKHAGFCSPRPWLRRVCSCSCSSCST